MNIFSNINKNFIYVHYIIYIYILYINIIYTYTKCIEAHNCVCVYKQRYVLGEILKHISIIKINMCKINSLMINGLVISLWFCIIYVVTLDWNNLRN